MTVSGPGARSARDTSGGSSCQPEHDLDAAWKFSTAGLIARGMRPRQWIKNLLVFMAPAAAGVLGDWHTTVRVVGAFVVFCVVASGTYLVNDVVDADSDRHHPVKRRRPVASGALRPRTATRRRHEPHRASPSPPRSSSGRGASPWSSGPTPALSIAYSLRLKHEPVVELAVVASCFVLRAVAGGVVAARAALELVPRLHLVRRTVRRDGEALRGTRPPGPGPRRAPPGPRRVHASRS